MTQAAFIVGVLTGLSGYWNPNPPSDADVSATCRAAKDCYREGFSQQDAVAYLRNLEHVDETIPEGIALARMAKIRSKYAVAR